MASGNASGGLDAGPRDFPKIEKTEPRAIPPFGRPGAAKLAGATITARARPVTVGRLHGLKLTYRSTSAPNPVTGKRVTLTVDRYELATGGRLATIDLGTPVGVDNVDAYRLMIQSFGPK